MGVRLLDPAREAYAYPLLVKQLLQTPWASSNLEIVYRDRVRLTYRDLIKRIHQLGGALAASGVQAGETVAVLDWDSHRYLECYFAVPMLGAVLQTVNIRMAPEDVAYTLAHAGAQTLIVHADFLPLVNALRDRLPSVRTVIPIADGDADVSAEDYEERLASAEPVADFPEFTEDAVATTFYTSGTTGRPKAVAFTHRQLVLHTLSTAAAMASAPDGQSFRRGDVYMPLTPMFHAHAWGFPYVATLLGVKQVYTGRYEAGSIIALRDREGVTYSHCVPTILQMLVQEAQRNAVRLDGWRMTIGGSSLSPALAAAAKAAGAGVFAGYGMSETGPNIAISRLPPGGAAEAGSDEFLRHPGIPLPLVQIRLVDPEMRPVPHDGESVGEVVIRSPWLTQAYVQDPAASDVLWAGGWLHTGDAGMIDAQGQLALADRMKDLVKSGGEWISSLQIENLIASHEGVAEAAVVAVPDARWGERPLAVVVAREGSSSENLSSSLAESMAAHAAKGAISRYAVPRIVLVAALPKTGTGKIDKKALRLLHCSETGAGSTP
ncbi:MAG: long-chain-fatty-acid--CoA ligase [Cypionkella sp.]